MESVYNVAQYIFEEYKHISGCVIDELKLHKLLYYAQRESIAITGAPMFNADFEGWKYGMVCRAIRSVYSPVGIQSGCGKVSFASAYILNNVINEYGVIESWQLSKLSHNEISWKNARIGLAKDDDGSAVLSLSDIRIDAKKVRPYDSVWDMYYDEFESVGCAVQ